MVRFIKKFKQKWVCNVCFNYDIKSAEYLDNKRSLFSEETTFHCVNENWKVTIKNAEHLSKYSHKKDCIMRCQWCTYHRRFIIENYIYWGFMPGGEE